MPKSSPSMARQLKHGGLKMVETKSHRSVQKELLSNTTAFQFISVPIRHPIAAFIKNAREAYRRIFPAKTRGRHSEELAIWEAMNKIFSDAEETSVRSWSQGRWTRKIMELTGITGRTIHKHLKNIIRRNPFPMHMIPDRFVKTLPLEQQRRHWYAVAIGETIAESIKHNRGESLGKSISIPYKQIYDRYDKLIVKHKVPVSSN